MLCSEQGGETHRGIQTNQGPRQIRAPRCRTWDMNALLVTSWTRTNAWASASSFLLQRETCPLESGQIGSSLVQGQAPSSRATALCPTVLPLKKRPRDDWGCVRGGTGILVLVSLRKCQVPRGLEAQAMTRATRVTHWRHAGAVESFPGSESAGEGRQRVSPCRKAQPQLSQDQASSLD